MFKLDVPEDLTSVLDPQALLPGWDAPIETTASTDIGDAWFGARACVALKVPSVAIRGETNVLLNPVHPDFGRVAVGLPEPFLFDTRLTQ